MQDEAGNEIKKIPGQTISSQLGVLIRGDKIKIYNDSGCLVSTYEVV